MHELENSCIYSTRQTLGAVKQLDILGSGYRTFETVN